jgi:hypothetical protein
LIFGSKRRILKTFLIYLRDKNKSLLKQIFAAKILADKMENSALNALYFTIYFPQYFIF